MKMMQFRPKSGGAHIMVTNSVATATTTSGDKGGGCGDGHLCGVVGHSGPCCPQC